VAIPVYNREVLVRRALESALSQPLAALEILVVDNCSTDRTWETVQGYSDPRLRLVRNESNVGLFGNFNRCLELASGRYVRFLCSDDRLPPACLPHEIDVMDQYPRVALLTTRGRMVDECGRLLRHNADHFRPGIYSGTHAIYAALWFQAHYGYNPFNYPSGVLMRRDTALRAGGFDARMKVVADVALFLRLLEGGDLAVTDTLGAELTIHPKQASAVLTAGGFEAVELFALLERYQDVLQRYGDRDCTLRQYAALCVALAVHYRWRGKPEASRLCREIAARVHAGPFHLAVSLLRLFWLRGLLKCTGVRVLPAAPDAPLDG
jgi:glycosyltransferase involved in cell wall biosynthesis